jgi:hypothetical protein
MTERRDVPENLRVKREPQRGVYDRATIDAILDEALVCHLGFEVDGQPYVIPTLHARIGDRLYVHGSAASRMLRPPPAARRTGTLLDYRARGSVVQPLIRHPVVVPAPHERRGRLGGCGAAGVHRHVASRWDARGADGWAEGDGSSPSR